jgi:large subunit ribosomal protein L10
MIVSEYRGLTVREISDIRATLRRQGIAYRVVKNRLAKIAARDVVGDALEPLLQGPTAIAFGEDEAATAKAVLEALRPYRVVRITGAVLGRQTIDAESVARLAALPPRETLLAEVAGAIAAPLATVAGLFDAPARSIVGLVAALAEKRAATGEAAA